MDTAPTGHALRLLEMPGLVQQWARALMAILLKYRTVVPLGQFGEILLTITKGVGRLEELLHDPGSATFIAVTRAASLPRLETARLARRLAKLRIDLPVVVINAVGHGDCGRCVAESRAERREIAATSRALAHSGRVVVLAGTQLPPPSGARLLGRWGATSWRRAPRYHQDA
jgi:arsenite-transporting ATPase